jgi:hypothetical protein
VQAKVYLPEAKGGYDDSGHRSSGLTIHRTLIEMPDGDLIATASWWFKQDVTPSIPEPKMDSFESSCCGRPTVVVIGLWYQLSAWIRRWEKKGSMSRSSSA